MRIAFDLMMIFITVFVVFASIGMALKLDRLQKLATELYLMGFWTAEGVSAFRACQIWTRFRDEFGIPPGTASAHAVGDKWNSSYK